MQLFNVTLHQNSKFGSLRLDWLFKLKTHWVAQDLNKSLKGWFVIYIQKQNFTRIM